MPVIGAEEKFLGSWYINKQFLSIFKEFYCLQSVLRYIITFGNTDEMLERSPGLKLNDLYSALPIAAL